ncbi:haloacid dehalogenase-like hydrolase [Akkermansiaceae bacterium]|nr:haloacid dehalogenase-like hydrolase [Akkermansiaceae bacterium]
MKKLALLDFDETLLATDSTKLFFRYICRSYISFLWCYYFRNSFEILFLLFFKDEIPLKKRRLRWVRLHLSRKKLNSFKEVLLVNLNKAVLNKVEEFFDAIDEVVIVSAGTYEIIKPIADHLNFSLIAKKISSEEQDSYNFCDKVAKVEYYYPNSNYVLGIGNSSGDHHMLEASESAWLVIRNGHLKNFYDV